jgi:hypothetical protein
MEGFINRRSSGKMNVMIMSMVAQIKDGKRVTVLGCKNPADITFRIKEHGLIVESEAYVKKEYVKFYIDELVMQDFSILKSERILGYTFFNITT